MSETTQCCMLRLDTGKRCTAMVPAQDGMCADCGDVLEREIQKLYDADTSKRLRERVGGGLG